MAHKIQIRRDTYASWVTTNPILSQGEIGYIIGTQSFKIGDGTSNWNDLLFSNSNLPPITLTDDYQIELIDLHRSSIRVNAAILKTMTMPIMTSAYDGVEIVFEIMGLGDVDLVRESTTTNTFAGVTHSKLTGTVQYSTIRLRYNHTLGAFMIQDGTGSWKGGAV